MALDSLQQALISTLQLHNSALVLLLERTKFDKQGLADDLRGQGEMLAAIEDGQADLAALIRGETPDGG
jgi:hypothetical protein